MDHRKRISRIKQRFKKIFSLPKKFRHYENFNREDEAQKRASNLQNTGRKARVKKHKLPNGKQVYVIFIES